MGFVAEADSSVPASRESSLADDHFAPWPHVLILTLGQPKR